MSNHTYPLPESQVKTPLRDAILIGLFIGLIGYAVLSAYGWSAFIGCTAYGLYVAATIKQFKKMNGGAK